MSKSSKILNYTLIGLLVVTIFSWPYLASKIWPPPPKPVPEPPTPALEAWQWDNLVGGGLVAVARELTPLSESDTLMLFAGGAAYVKERELEEQRSKEKAALIPRKETMMFATGSLVTGQNILFGYPQFTQGPEPYAELIGLGRGAKPFALKVLLNTRGGCIQQVILRDFQQADREGLPVKTPEGRAKELHLIPGVRINRAETIRGQREVPIPEIKEGLVPSRDLSAGSYILYHYEKAADNRPVDTLEKTIWNVVENTITDDLHRVVFETELGAPFYTKIRKAFTLRAQEYHVDLQVSLIPLPKPEGVKAENLRYQISGAVNMPIEGEWYSSTFRQGIVGLVDKSGSVKRLTDDAATVRHMEGSDPHSATTGSNGRRIGFAGVMLQYFASIIAPHPEDQPEGSKIGVLERARITPEVLPDYSREFLAKNPALKNYRDQPFLQDIQARVVTEPISVGVESTQRYVLYHGPVKVRLLRQLGVQLGKDKAISDELIDFYQDRLHLNTLTDAPTTAVGRTVNTFFWVDIIIFFTNLIHWLLGLLTSFIPNLGVCIILITFMVRGSLYPFSRKQAINGKIMQEKQSKIAPELKKLQEQYGNDFTRLNQEKMKLYREHGINPAAAFGGCLLLFAQMPVFMGLYFALQESIFFRLESFLWMPNLAAPDMLVFWSERIPWISTPNDLGSTLYLGPYLNLLPLIAVGLMLWQQSKMMPKSEDPQIQMQAKMMKFSMILFAFFFYKVAAGLCIYFICSSIWGIIERATLPKDAAKLVEMAEAKKKARREKGKQGWLGRRLEKMRKRMEELMEEAQQQQQIRKGDIRDDRFKQQRKKKK